jgi:hypothetical protein
MCLSINWHVSVATVRGKRAQRAARGKKMLWTNSADSDEQHEDDDEVTIDDDDDDIRQTQITHLFVVIVDEWCETDRQTASQIIDQQAIENNKVGNGDDDDDDDDGRQQRRQLNDRDDYGAGQAGSRRRASPLALCRSASKLCLSIGHCRTLAARLPLSCLRFNRFHYGVEEDFTDNWSYVASCFGERHFTIVFNRRFRRGFFVVVVVWSVDVSIIH